MAAAALARNSAHVRSSAARFLYHRSFVTPTAAPAPSPSLFLGSGLTRRLRPSSVLPSAACALRQIRCRVNRAGDSAYSPLQSAPRSGPNAGDRPAIENGPLFPGCDYEHWLIVMDKPGGEGASKHQMIDCYVQTLAKVLGSEEEAKKKIYNVSCERYFGFGCEIDEETSNKLEGLPGVLFVLPDSYVDVENKDYGAELFMNGQIVQRPPERQRKIDSIIQRSQQDRPNRTKYMRRRENQR